MQKFENAVIRLDDALKAMEALETIIDSDAKAAMQAERAQLHENIAALTREKKALEEKLPRARKKIAEAMHHIRHAVDNDEDQNEG